MQKRTKFMAPTRKSIRLNDQVKIFSDMDNFRKVSRNQNRGDPKSPS